MNLTIYSSLGTPTSELPHDYLDGSSLVSFPKPSGYVLGTPTSELSTLADDLSGKGTEQSDFEVVPNPFGYMFEKLRNLYEFFSARLPSVFVGASEIENECTPIVITEKIVQDYLRWDWLNLENNPSFQEASSANQKYHGWTTTGKADKLFAGIANNYMEEAETEKSPQHRAFLYAHVRKICTKHLKYVEEGENLKKLATFQEAAACLDAVKETTDCFLQAAWASKSAHLLDPHPTELPFWGDSKETSEKYTLASTSWEILADTFLTHKEFPKIDVLLSYESLISQYSHEPKYLAAIFYENAAYSIRNANIISQFRGKKYGWNDLHTRRIDLIDKSISVLETCGLKINDLFFNAEYFEMLAGLYQSKINTYITGHKEAPNLSGLKSKVFKFRNNSANLYNEILEENPTFDQYYYKEALNLREAALHVKTVGEAAELLKKAADSAATFRERKHVPLTHPTGEESEEERDAFHILASYWEMDKLLNEKGPDFPIPERK